MAKAVALFWVVQVGQGEAAERGAYAVAAVEDAHRVALFWVDPEVWGGVAAEVAQADGRSVALFSVDPAELGEAVERALVHAAVEVQVEQVVAYWEVLFWVDPVARGGRFVPVFRWEK